jgi:MarR family transcriptional regulator, organic hydroperoxide resistance regulator
MLKSKLVADIIDNIRRVFHSVNEYSKKAERETGLTGPQLWAIKVLAESAPIKVSELARKMYLHPATVVGILDRLETRELISRTRSVKDRRAVQIELTGKGRDLVAQAPEVAQGLLTSGLATLAEENLFAINDSLEQLVKILGAQKLPPRLLLSPEIHAPVSSELAAEV